MGAQRDDLVESWRKADPASEDIGLDRLYEAFTAIANDSLMSVVVWGYAPGALELIAADAWLSRKSFIWAATPEEMAALQRDLAAMDWKPVQPLRCHLCAGHHDLIEVFSTFGLHHGLVVLAARLETGAEIQRQRVRIGNRTSHGFARTLYDLHLLAERVRDPVEAVPLSRLKGLHAGRAAMCVAAGPSLDRRMPFLLEHQAHAVVIAADLVAHRLESAGVRVDFIVSVDTGDAIIRRCHKPLNPEAIAVLPLAADRRMDAIFPRRSYVWIEPTNSVVLSRQDAEIPSGTNVGSAVLGLAIYLGCAEAILVGHDLSFTTERLYSDCVDQKKELEDASLKAFRTRMQEVSGNGGGTVQTNTQFAMALEDMASMLVLHPGIRVYNINCSDGTGALIRGALTLPCGWDPPAIPAGQVPANEVLPVKIGRSFAAELEAQCAEFQAVIFGGLEAGRPLLEACAEAWGQSSRLSWASHLAEPLLGGVESFCLNELTRPLEESQPELQVQAGELVRTCLPRWFAHCRQALDEVVRPPPDADNKANDTLVGLFCAAPPPVRSSLQEILLPLYLSTWADLAIWMSDVELPLPARLAEAVTVVSRFGVQAPPPALRRILAMCAIDGSESALEIIRQARCDGLIPEGRLVAAAARDARDDHFGRAEAVLALRDPAIADGLDPRMLIERAVAEPFARQAAIEAALVLAADRPRAALALLAGLTEGWIPVSDAVAAACIELHPDTVGVLTALGVGTHVLGERTRLAVARRYMAIGDHAAALNELSDLRPLSSVGVEARALACVCLHRLGQVNAIFKVLGALPGKRMAARVLYRYADLMFPVGEKVAMLDGSGLDPLPVDVLAACLADAMDAGIGAAVVARLEKMCARAVELVAAHDRPAYEPFQTALTGFHHLQSIAGPPPDSGG